MEQATWDNLGGKVLADVPTEFPASLTCKMFTEIFFLLIPFVVKISTNLTMP
jgi:hypothetical protein